MLVSKGRQLPFLNIMSKDRKILNAVRMDDGTLYKTGQEEELAKVLKPEQIQRLSDQGALMGFVAEVEAPEEKKKK